MEAILRMSEDAHEKECLIHRIWVSICVMAGLVFLFHCAVTGMMDREYKLETSTLFQIRRGVGTDERIDEKMDELKRSGLPKVSVASREERIFIPGNFERTSESERVSNMVLEEPLMNPDSMAEEHQTGGQEAVLEAPAVCTVRLHGNGGVPELSVYQGDQSDLDASWTSPRKLGKEFSGWYLDAACTIPYEGEEGIRELDLYAGWRDFAGFISDDRGYLIGCTSELLVADGIFLLPVTPDCVGIASGAFEEVNESVLELYIPANITKIEEGALDSLKPLWYIEVDSDNPSYYSKDGVLYHRSGEVVKDPFTD